MIKKISKGTYIIEDRLFELWIAREGNYLEYKYDSVQERYAFQQELENPVFHPTGPII